MDQRDHPSIIYRCRQNLDESALIDRIKVLFQIQVHYILVAFRDVGLAFPQCIVRTSLRSESIAVHFRSMR